MKKILVVDDVPQMLRLVMRMLESVDGVELIAATTGQAAIKVCGYHDRTANSNSAGLYAVISDFDLGFGSPNGIRVLKAAPLGAIRVLMSGDLPIDCRPADQILEKPFSRGELLLALGLLENDTETEEN